MEADRKRRYVKRGYRCVAMIIKKMFKIPNDEMILDVFWDKSENELVIKTVIDWDSKKGDK